MRFPVMRCTFHDPGNGRPGNQAAEIAFKAVSVMTAVGDDRAHAASPVARGVAGGASRLARMARPISSEICGTIALPQGPRR